MTESGVVAVVRSLAVFLLAAAASCSESVVAPPEEPLIPVTVAGTRPATGRLRTEGGEMERGLRLAVVMLNEAGGIGGRPVQLLLRDDGSDPQAAAAIYRELVAADSIDLLVGPYASSITAAVVPVAEAASRPLVAPLAASHTIWSGQRREWSVQMPNDARDNLSGAVLVGARVGVESVAVVYEDSSLPLSAAEGVRGAVAELGLRLVMDETYGIGEADHLALAIQARDLGADLYLGGGYTEDAIASTRAVAEAGYRPLLSSWSVGTAAPDFPAQVGLELARCVIGNAPWVPSLATSGFLASNATFVERYEETHRVLPSYNAAAGFGAIELLAEAARASLSSDGEISEAGLRDYLFSTSTETVLGPFGVAPLGEPNAGSQRGITRLQLQWQDDGEGGLVQRVIFPDEAAEAEPCTNPAAAAVVASTRPRIPGLAHVADGL